jgi:hypothetical protein
MQYRWLLTCQTVRGIGFAKSREGLGKKLIQVLSFHTIKPNNSEAGMGSLTIVRLVLWEGQVVGANGHVT